MSCACENKKRMADIARMRDLAHKAAVMDGVVYVLFERKDGTFGFVSEGTEYDGEESHQEYTPLPRPSLPTNT